MVEVQSIASEWWGFSPTEISAPTFDPTPRSDDMAMFFTGGVDSFFTLIGEQKNIAHLVYVEGYDVSLRDHGRLRAVDRAQREIADALGIRLIRVRTNLRTLPFFRSLSWFRTYGQAIVAIGYLLSEHASGFLFASGAPKWRDFPRGNHTRLDPLWSSKDVVFEHHGGDYDRLAKVEAISSNLVAQRYLRVCWRNRSGRMNCGLCEKCIRTQLMLSVHGALGKFRTFPEIDLARAVRKLEGLKERDKAYYRDLLPNVTTASLRAEIERLLTRTIDEGRLPTYLSRFRRALSRASGFHY